MLVYEGIPAPITMMRCPSTAGGTVGGWHALPLHVSVRVPWFETCQPTMSCVMSKQTSPVPSPPEFTLGCSVVMQLVPLVPALPPLPEVPLVPPVVPPVPLMPPLPPVP